MADEADLIGPLTAAEWAEFRLRDPEDDDKELLQCCANTSEVRTSIFLLLRQGGQSDLLTQGIFRRRVWEVMQDHGMPMGRGTELLERMRDFYLGEEGR